MTQIAHITKEGRSNEKKKLLLELSAEFFNRTDAYIVVVGRIAGSKDRLIWGVLGEVGITRSANNRIKFFSGLNKSNIEEITSVASSPNCVGFVAFGLTDKQRELVKENFLRARVWDEYYNVFIQDKKVTASLLKGGLLRILEVLFEDELSDLAPS